MMGIACVGWTLLESMANAYCYLSSYPPLFCQHFCSSCLLLIADIRCKVNGVLCSPKRTHLQLQPVYTAALPNFIFGSFMSIYLDFVPSQYLSKQLDVCIIRLTDLKLSSPPEVFSISIFYLEISMMLMLMIMLTNNAFPFLENNTQMIGQGSFAVVYRAEYCGIQGTAELMQY
jgi:hypothetical protein